MAEDTRRRWVYTKRYVDVDGENELWLHVSFLEQLYNGHALNASLARRWRYQLVNGSAMASEQRGARRTKLEHPVFIQEQIVRAHIPMGDIMRTQIFQCKQDLAKRQHDTARQIKLNLDHWQTVRSSIPGAAGLRPPG